MEQSVLIGADDQQLLVLSLEQADPNRQVQRHDPELDTARVGAVECVEHEDHEQIDMEDEYGEEG